MTRKALALGGALLLGGAAVAAAWIRPEEPPPTAAPSVRTLRLGARPAAAGSTSAVGPTAPPPSSAPAPEDEPVADEPVAVETGDVPESLGRRDLQDGMDQLRPAVLACATETEPFAGLLTVHITIAKTGGVQSVEVLPPNDEAPIVKCVEKAVRAATFPRFAGTLLPTVELTFPFFFADARPTP
jgi:hypothetical protein